MTRPMFAIGQSGHVGTAEQCPLSGVKGTCDGAGILLNYRYDESAASLL